ncbi:MAG: phosphate ABC transporter substrate-binding protein [Gammaproteobacteria bacterium]|nr:phosphate ABC transporter substrate-binding protein [Gammaproteobacteria bacterium]
MYYLGPDSNLLSRGWLSATLLATVAFIGASGCSSDSSSSGKLVLTGSSTIAPLVAEIARRFEAANPGVRIDVQTGGSSRGIADTASGSADIGMASRALTADESAQLNQHLIAVDGVAVLLHASNPVKSLTRADLVAIYTGTTDNWKAFGGEDRPIAVIHRADGRSEVSLLSKYLGVPASSIQADLIVGENQHALKSCAASEECIVYMSLGAAKLGAEAGVAVRMIPVDGIAPTIAAVQQREFPIVRPLNLLTKGEPKGLAADFLKYAVSAEVNDLVEAQGYVALER